MLRSGQCERSFEVCGVSFAFSPCVQSRPEQRECSSQCVKALHRCDVWVNQRLLLFSSIRRHWFSLCKFSALYYFHGSPAWVDLQLCSDNVKLGSYLTDGVKWHDILSYAQRSADLHCLKHSKADRRHLLTSWEKWDGLAASHDETPWNEPTLKSL